MIARLNSKCKYKAAIALLLLGLLITATGATALVPSPSDQTNIAELSTSFSDGEGDILLTEGFEEGIMPPTNWDDQQSSGSKHWAVGDFISHMGEWMAYVNGDIDKQNEWLISPEIDTTDYTKVILTFWVNTSIVFDDWTVKILINESLDRVVWDLVENASNTPRKKWTKILVDLSDLAGQKFSLTWQYQARSISNDFYLDDILLQAWDGFIVDCKGPYEAYIYDNISFAPRVYGGREPYRYLWNFGDNRFSLQKNPTKYYRETGRIPVVLTSIDGSLYNAKNFTYVTINPWPIEIEIICGIGLNADVTNHVGYNLTNVHVEFFINGSRKGIARIDPDYTNDTIVNLGVNETQRVQSYPVPLGFGPVAIKVTATDELGNYGKCIKKVRYFGIFTMSSLIQ